MVKFVESDLWNWLRDLTVGLLKINFNENFQSFRVNNLKIKANTEIAIQNQFKRAYPGTIPSSRIIVRQQGNANIIDGPSTWTEEFVYLLNPSGNDATIDVIFFK